MTYLEADTRGGRKLRPTSRAGAAAALADGSQPDVDGDLGESRRGQTFALDHSFLCSRLAAW